MKCSHYEVQAIKDAFAVLHVLAERGPLGPTEIGAAIGVPKNRAFRYGRTLVAVGQCEALADGRYRLARASAGVLGAAALAAVHREASALVAEARFLLGAVGTGGPSEADGRSEAAG